VTDVKVEVKEEVIHGYRTVWKPVKEPCTHIIKRPVKVPVERQVPYTYYEPEEVTYEMVVPKESVRKQKGFRKDKVVVGKVVDVEQDELYELRPHHVGYGPPRIKSSDRHQELATQAGREIYTPRPGGGRYAHSPRPATARAYASSPASAWAWGSESRPGSSTSRLSHRSRSSSVATQALDNYYEMQGAKPFQAKRQAARQEYQELMGKAAEAEQELKEYARKH